MYSSVSFSQHINDHQQITNPDWNSVKEWNKTFKKNVLLTAIGLEMCIRVTQLIFFTGAVFKKSI